MPRIVIIGAGAAGTMAAIFAARAGAEVLLLEGTRDGGRKILISGGGRCNVLPSALTPSQYVTGSSPNTLKKLLLSWPLREQRRFFEEALGIRLELEEETGKLFPVTDRARDVRDALLGEARACGAAIHFSTRVERITPDSGAWRIESDAGSYEADRVIMGTGGLSVPATGSDGAGLRMVRAVGHTVHDTYPALTPLTATPPPHAGLAGVSLPVQLNAPQPGGPHRSAGGFLFTHRGYSGPSVLDISHLAVRARMRGEAQEIRVRWSPLDADAWDARLGGGGSTRVLALLRQELPDRLADRLLEEAGIDAATVLGQLRREDRKALITVLTSYPLPWNGDEGYKKAEVTGGGVALAEVDPRTLESRVAPGLHLCGEILDAFGPIGGYNFAWAWATGRLAGISAARGTTM